jgi:hypothetical protein
MRAKDPVTDPVGFRSWWSALDKGARSEYRFPSNLSYADMSELDLSGVDLSDRDLYNANLNGSDITGASFHGSELRAVQFHDAKYNENTDFSGAVVDWIDEDDQVRFFESRPKIVENETGEIMRFWVDENGDFHRNHDLPAVIWANGAQEWYQHGQRVRKEGG